MTAATGPRVAHVINGLETGGAEMMIFKLLSVTPAPSLVVSLQDLGTIGGRIRALGVEVLQLHMSRSRPSPAAIWRLGRLLSDWRPDVVQGWLLHGNMAATVAAALARLDVPVLWNVRWTLYDLESESLRSRAMLRLSAALSRMPARILYNSGLAAQQHEAIGYRAAGRVVIPNGFDLAHFHPDRGARLELRRELALPADAILVGMLARYHPMKDHANSLRAAALMAEQGVDAHFVYAGREVDPRNSTLVSLAAELGISHRVHLLGERRDTAAVLAGLDLYWMSSWARGVAEGFPNVVGEAMACGVPCVVTDVGDARVVVGETGEVVPPRDSRALAAAAVRMLRRPPAERAAVGAAARERIARDFDIELVARQYHALYMALRRDG